MALNDDDAPRSERTSSSAPASAEGAASGAGSKKGGASGAPPSEGGPRKGRPSRRRPPTGKTSDADRFNAWAFGGTVAGWVLLLLGERVLVGMEGMAKVATGLAVVLLVASFGQRLWAMLQAPADRRGSTRAFAFLSALGLVALALYSATTDWGRQVFSIDKPRFGEPDTLGDILTVSWISLVIISVVPTILGELSRRSMLRADRVESPRVIAAVVAGLSVAFALVYGSLFTYGAGEADVSVDFSFFRVAAPSDSTVRMLESLEEPLKVRVYFPSHSEVGQKVEKYLTDLNAKSGKLEVAVHDRLLVPDLAKEDKVMRDGVIVVERGPQTEQLSIGVDEARAASTLRKLDGEFQTTLLKVMRGERTAYLTVGHGELKEETDAKAGRSVRLLEEFMRGQNYAVKSLGLKEGLAREIPDDATMVLVLGPTEPFSDAEIASLERYAEGGGSLLLALDPDTQADLSPLAAIAGLSWRNQSVLHDQHHVPLKRNPSDRRNLIAGRFTSHPSVSTLSKASTRGAAVLLPGVAPLDKADAADQRYQIDFALKAQPGAYLDLNDNWSFDQDVDEKGNFNVVAAVSMAVDPSEDAKKPAEGAPMMRVFAVGDADAFSDPFIGRFRENQVFFMDAFRWLGGEESFTGSISEEEDIRIVHTKEEDQLWFYGAIFGLPSVLLGLGFWSTRRRRWRGGPSTTNEGDAPRQGASPGARKRRRKRRAEARAERAKASSGSAEEAKPSAKASEPATDEEEGRDA